ncbi:MAG TPA: hypothetical protein VN688_08455 [Gemmataceae bacterium]|nr:hypothetical protein [Gemmataceae bacterium]
MNNRWFDVDKEGLGKLVESHGKGRLIAELLQNALDERVTTVAINLTPLPGRPIAELVVEDDCPEGFKDLAHAYTLFADSYKKDDPEKRGRFNLGEKLVLALCRTAAISTTTGTVVFDESGGRHLKPRSKRERGSEFRATIRMTRAECDDAIAFLNTVLVPSNTLVTLNGQPLQPCVPLHAFEVNLDTEITDENRILRTRVRKTRVELFEPKAGEPASIYEMGLPVVETGDKWHINVCQKVPLNLNRDNVRPAYLQRLRTLVFNEMHSHLNHEDANSTWVQEATSHADCSDAGIAKLLDLRFGENRAAYDTTDPEASKRIQSSGGTIVTGSMLNKQQWQKAKEAAAIQPAGKISPSPRPYSDDPDAPLEKVVPPDQWTAAIRNIVDYAKFLAEQLMGVALVVKVTQVPNHFAACYGHGQLTFNLQRLSHRWFEQGPTEEVDELLIHEFGHEYSGDHLSDKYHEALCRLGAQLKRLALSKPDLFGRYLPV